MLAAQLADLFPGESMQRTVDGLGADERSLDLAVALALAERPAGERVVLVVDQFEEVFTLCIDEIERTAFLANLCYAASIPGGRLVVIVAMRADFYHRCAPYPQLAALTAARQFLVGPLDRDGLREVIERPAWRANLELEGGLVETILDDVAGRPGSLPLLEYVLLEVWQRRQDHRLTLEAYVAAGRVEGALAQRANTVYGGLTPVQQQIARRVLLRLVQPGEGSADTRRRAEVGELLTQGKKSDLEVVVRALADARLLITGQDELTGARVVDVAHEALIQGWPQLRMWIEENREALRAQRRLTEAAAEWDHSGRVEEFLYRGSRLAAWKDCPIEDLNALERAFLAASSDRERDELAAAERRNRRLRALSGILAVLLVLVGMVSVAAVQQRQVAQQRGDLATARQLAGQAAANIDQQPLSLLLSLESLRLVPTDEARASLLQALLEPRRNVMALTGHAGTVFGAVFSPDARIIASASEDRTVRRWDATTGVPIGQPLTGHTGIVRGVAFSPDSKMIVSVGRDRTVRRWDATTGAAIGPPLTGHTDRVEGVAFSPDGKTIASVSRDETVRRWDAATGAPIGQPLTGHANEVMGVAFSPDGKTIASVSRDETVRRWDAATGAPIGQPLTGHANEVMGVAFSPDGKTIASVGRDRAVRLWDAATGKLLGQPLTGHTELVEAVAFSPDGKMIASAGLDRTVRRWDAATGKLVGQPLTGHSDEVVGVMFSPDSKMIISAGEDGTVLRWEAATGKLVGQPLTGRTNRVEGMAFSPNGKMIAAATDQTVRLWPISMDAWIQHACTLVNRNLRLAEWNQFIGLNSPYVRTCPDLPSGYGAPVNAPPATYHLD